MGGVASGKYVYKPGDHKHLYTWRSCAQCDTEYLGRVDSNSRYCSRSCAGKANGIQPRPAATQDGHLVCTKCGAEKPEDAFSRHSRSKSGRRPACRACHAEYWLATRTPEILARMRENDAKRWAENPEEMRARARDQAARWRAANPERHRENERRWREANRDRRLHSEHKRRAQRLRTQIGEFTPATVKDRWDFYGGCCWMCGGTAKEWDHVKPLAKGGSHCLANLRPACSRCNRSKRDRWPYRP